MLSSSLRSLPSLVAAVSPPTQAADLVAFARPSLLHPALPLTHLCPFDRTPIPIPPHRIPNFSFYASLLSVGGRVKLIGAGLGTIWYDWQMSRIGRGLEVNPNLGVVRGLLDEYGAWLASRLVGVAAVAGAVWWTVSAG